MKGQLFTASMVMYPVNTILLIITYLSAITAYLAVVHDVSLTYSGIFACLLLLSIALHIKRIIHIPGWALNAVSVGVVAVSLCVIRADHIVEPVLEAFLILMAIKFLARKKVRDYLQIHMLCIFLLVGTSLLSLSILFMAYFTALGLLSTTALMLLAYLVEDQHLTIHRHNLLKILFEALLICLVALPASLLFFIILPRTDFPLLSFLNQGGYAKVGFSDQVQLGTVAQIQQNNSVVFRAQMAKIDTGTLYWRGIVLDQFNGVSWKSTGERSSRPIIMPPGPRIRQVIYLDPYGERYLFALDKPVSLSLRHAIRYRADTYEMRDDIDTRIRYQAMSVLSDWLPASNIDRQQDLQLPPGFSPRIRALVRKLEGQRKGLAKIEPLLHFLKYGDYRYSLKDLPTSSHPLQDFLFKYKRGNCEYFASALAVMLRMAGIPARLVGGYRGGYYNPAGSYYLVLENNAHVWVEAYLAGHGWRRLDPTPYTLANPALAYQQSFWFQVKLLLDTFNYYWYKFIINYNLHKQLVLFNQVKSSIARPNLQLHLSLTPNRLWLIGPGVLLLLVLSVPFLRRRRATPAELLLTRFLNRMDQVGYHKEAHEGLEEFASKIENLDLQRRATRFIGDFEQIYYKDGTFSREDMERLGKVIDEI